MIYIKLFKTQVGYISKSNSIIVLHKTKPSPTKTRQNEQSNIFE